MIRTRRVLASGFLAAATLSVGAGMAQAAPAEDPKANPEADVTIQTSQLPEWMDVQAAMNGSLDFVGETLSAGLNGDFARGMGTD
ncbi:hypothetical protein [Saccharomonospora iraqiensis]|uniref:hypothetical protein n=1 Tax=Saccharomonospora iraqiensis TaxID=52698 RepID=UPI00047C9243|nr:hypothetical protein [Saccharomonospora iraqiensis]